jgi:sulfur-carrier protein
MRVTVRLFARLREIAGTGDLERELPDGATVGTVWETLVAEWRDLEPHARTLSSARNLEHARFDTPVADGDEVAFLPPVSGG